MADKKKKNQPPDENVELEKRVDKMMDPHQPEEPSGIKKPEAPAAAPKQPESLPPIDIFEDSPSAPEVPKELLGAASPEPPEQATSAQTDTPVAQPGDKITPDEPAESAEPAGLDDLDTDKAVDDIVAKEGDEVLAKQDAETEKKDLGSHQPERHSKLGRFFRSKKTWAAILALAVIIAAAVVPTSRYKILALFMKQTVSVTVQDSATHTPVTGASVSLNGQTAKTDNYGKASLKVPVGDRKLKVTKQYYQSYSKQVLVALPKAQDKFEISLVATGRQVPVTVVNKITGQPLSNAEISVLNTEAKTDNKGLATIVLPTSASTQVATVALNGYNALKTKVQITNQAVTANKFALTPAGKVFFLSNLSGNIDVVKTNLDGTDRVSVVAGTGREDPNSTQLLASRDWSYLALLSQRDGGKYAKLFLINTSNDQLSTIDESAADFLPVGWAGHKFIYEVSRANMQNWQNNQTSLMSYDADTAKVTTLDQTSASGSSGDNYVAQDFGSQDTYIINGNQIVYVKEWTYGYLASPDSLNGKQDQILSVSPDGSGKKVIKSLGGPSAGNWMYIYSVDYNPEHIYFQVADSNSSTYYDFTNGVATKTSAITTDAFNKYSQANPTYLLSPDGTQTFWSEERDGKNTLFVGDSNGHSGKQIASQSDYSPYGWYGNRYLLVQKGGSELYVMSASGGTPIKTSDYYKPPRPNYGNSYGP